MPVEITASDQTCWSLWWAFGKFGSFICEVTYDQVGVFLKLATLFTFSFISFYIATFQEKLTNIVITNQVCETRSFMIAGRSRMISASKWHNVSLQGGHKLIHNDVEAVPPCPANQSKSLVTSAKGPRMSHEDEVVANKEVPDERIARMKLERHMREVVSADEWIREQDKSGHSKQVKNQYRNDTQKLMAIVEDYCDKLAVGKFDVTAMNTQKMVMELISGVYNNMKCVKSEHFKF